jgi:hypothetical protein
MSGRVGHPHVGLPPEGCFGVFAGRFKVPPKAEVAAAAPPAETAATEAATEAATAVEAEVEVAVPAALEPKVMAPFDTPAGEVPRRVQIERKKRLYASQDIGELLQAEGVNSFLHQPSGLELSYFDNREYDSRTFEEWTLPEALEQGVKCKVSAQPREHSQRSDHPWVGGTAWSAWRRSRSAPYAR